MTFGFCPFAVNRNINPGSSDPAIKPRVAILHVDAGNASSLFTFFRDRSGGIESHFHIRKDGVIEQYRSIFFQADANLKANDFGVSIETQGFGEGTWTAEQLASIKRLLAWLHHATQGAIPLRKVRFWDGSGVGYHTLFGAPSPWTPVAKSCPGPDRKRQFHDILEPWFKTALEPKHAAIRTVSFNCGTSQRGARLRRNLRRLAKRRPHIILLQEAKHFNGTIKGYKRYGTDGVKSTERGQSVILVREDGKVHKVYRFAAKGPRWRGPQGGAHDPRIFIGVSVTFDNATWDVLNVHRVWTKRGKRNMEAWAAEDAAILQWVAKRKADKPNRSIALIGDHNSGKRDRFPLSVRTLARRTKGWLHLTGIDGAVAIGCKATAKKRKSRFGSDHRPVNVSLTQEI